jgi:hypothetical protein
MGGAVTVRRRRWRWLRLVAPAVAVLVLVTFSGVAYGMQQPDESDPAYLSPTSRDPIGAARLADAVRARGIPVERATRTSDALVSAFRGDATLLIPAPSLVHPYYLRMLKLMPASTRVVLVAPTARTLAMAHLPVGASSPRWAAVVEGPGCAAQAVRGTGRAAIRRTTFGAPEPDTPATERHRCYGGGLVELGWYRTSLTLVGSSDVFRNDRIGEHDNRAVAAGLVTGTTRVVWLDVHKLEPRPGVAEGGAPDGAPPSLSPREPDPDFSLPGTPGPGPVPEGGGGDPGGGRAAGRDSPLSVFPAVAWAVLAVLVAAAVLLAAARARRLGAPVREPLPVTVPAAETTLGRGRLYQRAKARSPAFGTLRAAARDRLCRLLDLPPDVPDEALVAATAAQSGWPAAEVEAALFPLWPEDDDQFVAMATNLTNLMRAVTRTDEGDLR